MHDFWYFFLHTFIPWSLHPGNLTALAIAAPIQQRPNHPSDDAPDKLFASGPGLDARHGSSAIARRGGPWKSFFEPAALAKMLAALGFARCRALTPED